MHVEDVAPIDFTQYDLLITTGTVLAAEPFRGATLHAFKQARQAGTPLIFDVSYRPYSWRFASAAADVYSQAASLCDIIIGNYTEFGFMAGDYDAGLDKARELANSSASIVVYKMGEHGAITIIDSAEFETGILPSQRLNFSVLVTVSCVALLQVWHPVIH